jgi:hypothetical protein
MNHEKIKRKLNSVVWVSERTIPTERQPHVSEVSANFCGLRMPRGKGDGSLRSYSRFSRPEPLLFLLSSSSIGLTRLSSPYPDPILLRKSDRAGNRTRISESVAYVLHFFPLLDLRFMKIWAFSLHVNKQEMNWIEMNYVDHFNSFSHKIKTGYDRTKIAIYFIVTIKWRLWKASAAVV